MQELNFGKFLDLVIRDGEPICDPPPQRKRELKFPGENGPRRERETADFSLKSEVVELFAYFDQLKNGTIDVLEVKHGLPSRMTVTEATA
jgi:hypothetical protein